ncbi:hypothetical protein CH063_15282, partial [Colletotrichum higginsianum]
NTCRLVPPRRLTQYAQLLTDPNNIPHQSGSHPPGHRRPKRAQLTGFQPSLPRRL